jgi:hypothetical protein
MRTFPRVILTCLALTALAAQGCSKSEEREPTHDAGAGSEDDAAISGECDSTWKAIQRSIFEGKRCAQGECHGANKPAGGLDLRPSVAYDNLIYADSQASLTSPLYRVYPGEQALSFLYLKLAAASDETATLPPGGGSPMPVGTSPLSAEELAAVRLWIRAGAPETGVVEGTQALLDCELSEAADPNKTIRPPVPAVEEGFQHVAGPWNVPAHSENEVCFATYYDLTDAAPDWARFPCELQGDEHTCVGFKRRQLSQDGQSHHSIISVYTGATSPLDGAWGAWRCAGGPLEGTSCDPTRLGVSAEEGGAECGEAGVCQSEVRDSLACRGYGPADKDMKQISAGGAQSPVSTQTLPDGVFGEIPIKGVIIWNSHGFNLTDKDTTVEQFNTYWYAPPEERVHLVRRIFDQRYIFTMQVPPFQSREYCATFTLPQYARLSELGSHVHQRGVKWRTWLPPQEPDCLPQNGCAPNEDEPFYESLVYNDPLALPLEPALQLDSDDPADRTLKYCAVYDNGDAYPELVKRASALPEGSRKCNANELYCLGGERQGEQCASDDDCGEGGLCDACTVTGGVTIEDEMFILLGFYYVVPPDEN